MATESQMRKVEQQLRYVGSRKWQDAGYVGKNGVCLNLETPMLKPRHCESCTQSLHFFAPAVTVHEVAHNGATSGGKYTATGMYKGKRMPLEDIVEMTGAKVLMKSIGGKLLDPVASAYWNDLKKTYNLIFFTSAGNDGAARIGGAFPADVAIYVGAAGLSDRGVVSRMNYSAIGKDLDFLMFTNFRDGTSFASPDLAGMAFQIMQKFGYERTQDEVYAYLKSICKDLDVKGVDANTGWGLPILP